jgi:hypothetical protein
MARPLTRAARPLPQNMGSMINQQNAALGTLNTRADTVQDGLATCMGRTDGLLKR